MNTSRIAIERLEKKNLHNEMLNAEISGTLFGGVLATNVAIACHTIDLINESNLSPKNKLIAHGINLGTFAIVSAVIGVLCNKSQDRCYYSTNTIVETANEGIVEENC
jgi:hypothetical protein